MFFFLLISCTPTTEKDPNTSSSTTDGTNTTDTDADTDSDTDADSDSDTDSDTDSDSDTDTTNTDPCTTTVDLCAKGDCIYDVVAQPVRLSGAISYGGQQIPDTYGSSYQEWALRLVDTNTLLSYDYQMDGGSDTYKVDVYPGEYDVYFRLNYDSIFPGGITDLTRLGSVSVKKATTYDLAPAPVKLSGSISYDGQQIPDTYGSSYQEWNLRLVDTVSGLSYDYQMDGGSDKYKIDAYPGTYDVYFRLNYDSIFPGGITDWFRIEEAVKLTASDSLALAPEGIPLSGAATYDNQTIPDTYGSSYQEWSLQFQDQYTGLYYSYELDGAPTYDVEIPAGTYNIFFRLNYDSIFDGGITDWGRLESCAEIH